MHLSRCNKYGFFIASAGTARISLRNDYLIVAEYATVIALFALAQKMESAHIESAL
jgi:hypothetical protein